MAGKINYWTPEQDALLIEAREKLNMDWLQCLIHTGRPMSKGGKSAKERYIRLTDKKPKPKTQKSKKNKPAGERSWSSVGPPIAEPNWQFCPMIKFFKTNFSKAYHYRKGCSQNAEIIPDRREIHVLIEKRQISNETAPATALASVA